MISVHFTFLFALVLVLGFSFMVNGSTGSQIPLKMNTDTNKLPDLYEASIEELQEGLEKGRFTSVDLVKVRMCIM